MSNATYHKSYKTFRGVDFSSERSACDDTRFNYLINMWRDYHSESGAAIETSPGFRKLLGCDGGKINGMHFLPTLASGDIGKLIVHRGTGLHVCTLNDGEQGLEATEETTVAGAAVADARSRSVLQRNRLYIVDGQKYFSVSESDNGAFATDDEDFYVPTTYLNGEPYEQRNLLTDEFVEKYTTSEDQTTYYLREPVCADTTKLYACYDGVKNIPYFVTDGDRFYYRYSNPAFKTKDGEEVTPSFADPGIPYYGVIYKGTVSWESVMLTEPWYYYIENGKCISVVHVNGKSSSYVTAAENAYVGYFSPVFYAKDGEEVTPSFADPGIPYYGVIYKGTVSWEQAPGTGASDPWYYYIEDGKCFAVVLSNKESSFRWDVADNRVTSLVIKGIKSGVNVEIHGFADSQKFNKVGDFRDVLTGNPDFSDSFTGTALDAINGCTLITEFDGRIFLSGNPKLPNSVFYTQRDLTGYNNPFYIGAYNYLNDGTGSTPITAMMTTPTHLIVLKDDVAQGASIYYHTAQDNPSSNKVTADLQPRIYPRENGVPGLGCLGVACNFRDDPVFLSPHGLEAVGKSQVNLERTIVHRSSYVDAYLRNEDLRNVSAAEWDGYLAILVPGGRMYLADSREMYQNRLGGYEYEWYFWDDIGTWTGTKNRYYYVTSDEEGEMEIDGVIYTLAAKENEGFVPDDAEPHAVTVEDGTTRYYVIEGEYAYPCDTSGEQIGGSFREATALLSVNGRLLFGTSDGSICVFNTDRRDENHYIPPEDYTHCGRRYLSGCATKSDSCGRQNVTKSTARGSVVLKTKAFPYALITVKVRTNVTPWKEVDKVYGGENDFDHTDFSRFTFNPSAECLSVINEHERKWVEKQFFIFSECWESPFGIVGLSYDYSIAGKVRMR